MQKCCKKTLQKFINLVDYKDTFKYISSVNLKKTNKWGFMYSEGLATEDSTFNLSFAYDDDFDEYDADFDDDFDDYEEDEILDEFDDDVDLLDDVFKEEDIDEPYDDTEPEDGSFKSADDEYDISFLKPYDDK